MTRTNLDPKLQERMTTAAREQVARAPVRRPDFRGALPPYFNVVGAFNTRLRAWIILYFATVLVLSGVILIQNKTLSHRLFKAIDREFLIVPGAPEFIPVRTNKIPDSSVFGFAEFVANHIGTFTYRNVSYHYGKVLDYMTPKLRGEFDIIVDLKLKEWSERRTEQVFGYEPVKEFDLQNDSKGPVYTVFVEGTISRYVDGKAFDETREVLHLKFRTKNITAEKSFFFEIDTLEWMNPDQFLAIKASRGEKRKGRK
jgi:hypothetical protein